MNGPGSSSTQAPVPHVLAGDPVLAYIAAATGGAPLRFGFHIFMVDPSEFLDLARTAALAGRRVVYRP